MAPSSPTITIPLQGGLGNQLFQLAAGTTVSERLGRPVVYSDHWLRNPLPGETPRAFALAGLIRSDELVSTRAPRTGGIADRLLRHRVIERAADDDALARAGSRTRVLAGYFQRLDYVREAWPSLEQRFHASPEPLHRALVTPSASPFGALHYRLGDYASNPGANTFHGVTSPEYFAEVIRYGSALGITSWMVVSDDAPRAVALLEGVSPPAEAELVVPESNDDWSDLAVLASASLCAISNSSFSWWAAFIGSRSHGMRVLAPRPWFADPAQAEPALFPESWERRDRSLLTQPSPSTGEI